MRRKRIGAGRTVGPRRTRPAVTVLSGALAVAGAAWATGVLVGFRGFAFAWVLHLAMMAWMSASLEVTRPALRSRWFRVRGWEPGLYRRLGVPGYGRLLRRTGWERRRGNRRSFDGTRAGLAELDRQTRRSEVGHLVPAVVGAALATVAAGAGAPDAAAWLFGLTVVLHVPPVLLQRTVRARIDRARQRGRAGVSPACGPDRCT